MILAKKYRVTGKNGKRVRRKKNKLESYSITRLWIVFGVLVLAMSILILRLVMINLKNNENYTRIVMGQMDYDSKIIPFKRGDIKDRNGTVLATSEKVYNLILDPYVVVNSTGDCKEPTAKAIEQFFGIPKEKVIEEIDKNDQSRYVVLDRALDYDTVKAYQDFMAGDSEKDKNKKDKDEDKNTSFTPDQVQGIWFEEEYKRIYPYNSLAAAMIGFTVSGDEGIWGLEGYYNDMLNGTDGREYGYLSEGTDFERQMIEAVNGYNVVSTIDLNIQRIVEKYVSKLYKERGSKNTGVIVANPNTGEILAMASAPTFDLNDPRNLTNFFSDEDLDKMSDENIVEFYNKLWRNFCISDTFEAGSTIKPMTVGAVLDENKVDPNEEFICDGGEDLFDGVGTQHIPCHNINGHGKTSLEESLMWSCNDVMMQISTRLGAEDMLKYHRLYGFGQKTGIDLPGEASAEGLVFDESSMGSFELATSSFGQGFNVSMVQMVAAFSSIVNGGHYYQPHVVKEIRAESGNIVKSFDKVAVRNTLSKETCDWLKEAMYQTVADDGPYTTGKAARVDGYKIGGKTGTAEKVPRGSGKYVVSFIGFAPVENPQVVVYVVIDELKDNQEDSSAPTKMAGDILKEVLPYLQIFPEDANANPGETTKPTDDLYQWGTEGGVHTEEAKPEEGVEENHSDDSDDSENGGAEAAPDPNENHSDMALEEFLSQWTDEDGDGFDDLTGDYYWDDLAEFQAQNGTSE